MMKKILIYIFALCTFLISSSSIVNAELPICNESEIKKSMVDDYSIDKQGYVKEIRITSFSNIGSDCLMNIKQGYSIGSDVLKKDPEAYDDQGKSQEVKFLEPGIMYIDYDTTLSGGKVYKVFLELELEHNVKGVDDIFYLQREIQISGSDKLTDVVMRIEKRCFFWEIDFNQLTPYPNRVLDKNVLIWELGSSEIDRSIEKITIMYQYKFNWNIFAIIFITFIVTTILNIIFRGTILKCLRYFKIVKN